MKSGDDPGYYEALGRAVKVLRTERGIGRRELADASGVSYPYLSEIENGKKRPSSRALLQIADALGVQPSALLEATESYVGTIQATRTVSSPPPPAAFAAAAPARPAERRWFHFDQGASVPEMERGSVADEAGDERLGLIRELLDLSAEMREDDLRRLLDLARRLRG